MTRKGFYLRGFVVQCSKLLSTFCGYGMPRAAIDVRGIMQWFDRTHMCASGGACTFCGNEGETHG